MMSSGNPLPQAATTEVIVLDLRADTSVVLRMSGAKALLRTEFALGVDALVRQSLRHEPPRPIELEHAIELTEEAVMPLAAQFAGSARLMLQGLGASLIARSLETGGVAQTALTLDEVESLFNRLVAVSLGRPASQETLPTDARFFAAMLMLREFMHHLHFTQVTLQV
jgi:hypothetical protein